MELTTILILCDSEARDWGELRTLAFLLQPCFDTVDLMDVRELGARELGDIDPRLAPETLIMVSALAAPAVSRACDLKAKKILLVSDAANSGNASGDSAAEFDLILELGSASQRAAGGTSATRSLGAALPAMTADWLENPPRDHLNQFVLAIPRALSPALLQAAEKAVARADDASALDMVVKPLYCKAEKLSELRHSDLALVKTESDFPLAFHCAFFAVPLIPVDEGCESSDDEGERLSAYLLTLMETPLLRRKLVQRQRLQLDEELTAAVYQPLFTLFKELGFSTPDGDLRPFSGAGGCRIEGPFDTSYSLAMVNRFAALGLAAEGETVSISPVEAVGNYPVAEAFYRQHPEVAELVSNHRTAPISDTVLRMMYPLRLTEMYGVNNGVCCFAWEESALPAGVVETANPHLQLITTTSRFVANTLSNNGVYTPTIVSGNGADHILESEPDGAGLPDLGGGLKFLHISSCFPRKGLDVLLSAYGAAFTNGDDVALIIKTFPNPHHDIDRQIKAWKAGIDNPPTVIVINRDLEGGAIRHLYQQVDVLVAPSRGEGFGLPLAEAMLHRIPVITTGYGGQMDFCSPETAWLVDFKFAPAETHMGLSDSVWVEPDKHHLRKLLSEFHGAWIDGRWKELCDDRVTGAYETIDGGFRWRHVARRIIEGIQHLDTLPAIQHAPSLGVVTTWNSKCGIAAYSRLLLEPALSDCLILANRNAELISPDEDNVVRCWDAAAQAFPQDLFNEIMTRGLQQVLFQFNFGFFSASGFKDLLGRLHENGIQTFVTCHSTAGGWQGAEKASLAALQPELNLVEKIFAHAISDLNRLKDFGAVSNSCLFPHGVAAKYHKGATADRAPRFPGKRVIACYGFLLPHKGLLQLIDAFSELVATDPGLHLLLVNAIYPAEISTTEAVYCRNLIRRRKLQDQVTLITDFLEDEDSIDWLKQADFVVFPYQQTSESSSAAIRWGLASGKPVYCTPLSIFDDVGDVVNFLPGTSPEEIRQGLAAALALAPQELDSIAERQNRWLEAHDWPKLSRRLKNTLRASFTNKAVV